MYHTAFNMRSWLGHSVAVIALLLLNTATSQARPAVLQHEPLSFYDYIIVGAGSAGGVLAGRLSEDPDVSVLLLEAGGDDADNYFIRMPYAYPFALISGDLVRTYVTEPQDGLFAGYKGNRVFWGRGNVLGGSSSVNVMFYVRGSRHDFDRWANHTGDETWQYRHVLPYFLKSEGTADPVLTGSEYHNTAGPIGVTVYEKEVPIEDDLVETFEEMGIPLNEDYNGEALEGIGRSQMNVKYGERSSSASGYIHPAMKRANFHVIVRAFVEKVVMDGNVATGVEFIKDGKSYRVSANKEVILSAGSLGSPQILLLSGIGPRSHLEEMNITVHADLPVGQNLQDHVLFPLSASVTEPVSTTFDLTSDPNATLWAASQYAFDRTGPLSQTGCPFTGFHSITEENKAIDWPEIQVGLFSRPFLRPQAMAYNYAPETLEEINPEAGNYGWTCWFFLLRPSSRGNLTLRTTNPLDDPILYANYFSKEGDIDVLLSGIDLCKEAINTRAMAEIGATQTVTAPVSFCSQHEFDSREYWDCRIRATPHSVWHFTSSCSMGASDDPEAVVDPQLRVRGVERLRVVDASVMPFITTGNTNAATYMIAEKAADLILGRSLLPPIDLD